MNDYNANRIWELRALADLGWLPAPVDSASFDEAVAAWQKDNALVADGKCGPASWAKMRNLHAPSKSWLATLPRGEKAIRNTYGAPGPERLAWSRVRNVRVHELVRDEFDFCLSWGIKSSGYVPASVQTYNLRRKRGVGANTGDWSTHSWGIAFDVDPASNPYVSSKDKIPLTATVVCYPALLAAFRALGWSLGMDWKTPDLMHVQACTGY